MSDNRQYLLNLRHKLIALGLAAAIPASFGAGCAVESEGADIEAVGEHQSAYTAATPAEFWASLSKLSESLRNDPVLAKRLHADPGAVLKELQIDAYIPVATSKVSVSPELERLGTALLKDPVLASRFELNPKEVLADLNIKTPVKLGGDQKELLSARLAALSPEARKATLDSLMSVAGSFRPGDERAWMLAIAEANVVANANADANANVQENANANGHDFDDVSRWVMTPVEAHPQYWESQVSELLAEKRLNPARQLAFMKRVLGNEKNVVASKMPVKSESEIRVARYQYQGVTMEITAEIKANGAGVTVLNATVVADEMRVRVGENGVVNPRIVR